MRRNCEAQLERDLQTLGDETDVAAMAGESSGAAIDLPIDEEPPERYLAGVEAALAAIGRGDVYQANLSRRWRARLKPGVDATDIYRRLRRANPAPFAGVAHLPGFSVLSSSPERLLRVENGTASTRPIAGTRPRGQTRTSDESLRSELRLNEKEQAEHVMLVDLERNDLGRVCRAGTVRVDEYMTIESYTHVHHIVSNVRGELRDDVDAGPGDRGGVPRRHDHRLPENPLYSAARGTGARAARGVYGFDGLSATRRRPRSQYPDPHDHRRR